MKRVWILRVLMLVAIPTAGTIAAPKHIMFAFVDHFEPTGSVPDNEVNMWVDDYAAMASCHIDADGRHPIHSYFLISLPVIEPDLLHYTLIKLNQATYGGYGEVEFHCHHGVEDESKRTEQEATDDLLCLISQTKAYFNMHGALVTAQPEPQFTFGFIHGMWALDNSRLNFWSVRGYPHFEYCGVNREMEFLSKCGAYADFTFPAWGPMDPLLGDAIFYAADDDLPASYHSLANIHLVEVNRPSRGDLMIVEGPWGDGDLSCNTGSSYVWPTLSRMDRWLAHNVHIIGYDDWIFIKVHTHGCAGDISRPDIRDCLFGTVMDNFYTDMEQRFNDGVHWKLHYVSAREMYNIIKAAEAGETGDPDQYRDYVIPPYANMVILTKNQYNLISYDAPRAVSLEILDKEATVEFSIKNFGPNAIILEAGGLTQSVSAEASDSFVDRDKVGELHFLDTTPSRFYFISAFHGDGQLQTQQESSSEDESWDTL